MGHNDELTTVVPDNVLDALADPDCLRIVCNQGTFGPIQRFLEHKKATDPMLGRHVDKLDPFFTSETFRRRPHRSATPAQLAIPTIPAPNVAPDKTSGAACPNPPKDYGIIMRNKEGKRIDPIIKVYEGALNSVKRRIPKLCNNFHLRGHCAYGNSCGYAHGYLSEVETIILRAIAREQPCREGSACTDQQCYAGHRCIRKKRCDATCRFSKEMHFDDKEVVNDYGNELRTSALKLEIKEILRE